MNKKINAGTLSQIASKYVDAERIKLDKEIEKMLLNFESRALIGRRKCLIKTDGYTATVFNETDAVTQYIFDVLKSKGFKIKQEQSFFVAQW